MNLGLIVFIVAILIVVMIHESGHFFVAKAFNFKATKYFIGFGPTIWSTTRGETEYGVKALPLGGFVKIVGMNPYEEIPPEDLPRSYANKPIWQRALVIVAGSATHFVVAFLILMVTAMTIGFPTERSTNVLAVVDLQMSDGSTSPAAEAGLLPDDEIVAVNGAEVGSWQDIRTFIQNHRNESVTFTVLRDGERLDLEATIGSAIIDANGEPVEYVPPGEGFQGDVPVGGEIVGFVGVSPEPAYEKESLLGAVREAGSHTWGLTKDSFKGIGEMFGTVFGGELLRELGGEGEREADEGAGGIVTLARLASNSVQTGNILHFIFLIAFFTVFVGLMNLLPLPPLDGGHLAVLAYEKITGKTVDIRKLIPVAAFVISFFVILFVAVLYLDIARPIKVPF